MFGDVVVCVRGCCGRGDVVVCVKGCCCTGDAGDG